MAFEFFVEVILFFAAAQFWRFTRVLMFAVDIQLFQARFPGCRKRDHNAPAGRGGGFQQILLFIKWKLQIRRDL